MEIQIEIKRDRSAACHDISEQLESPQRISWPYATAHVPCSSSRHVERAPGLAWLQPVSSAPDQM